MQAEDVSPSQFQVPSRSPKVSSGSDGTMFEPLPASINPVGGSWQMRLPAHWISARSEGATSPVLAVVAYPGTLHVGVWISLIALTPVVTS